MHVTLPDRGLSKIISGTSQVVCDDASWPVSYQLVQLTAKSISRPAIHGDNKQRWKVIYVTFEHKHHINACRCRLTRCRAGIFHINKTRWRRQMFIKGGPRPRCVTKYVHFSRPTSSSHLKVTQRLCAVVFPWSTV